MALEFKKWLIRKLGGAEKTAAVDITADEMWDIGAEIYIRELAFWACVNLMGQALANCHFKTFRDGKEIKGSEYYLWNYSPNGNQNSSVFLNKWVAQLFRHNEALVIEYDGQLLVADSYSRREFAVRDDLFDQVTVGDFQFRKTFAQSDVLYVQLSPKNMAPIVNGLYEAYRKLIAYGMSSYQKSRGTKGIVKIDSSPGGNAQEKAELDRIFTEGFKTFANAENALFRLNKGMEYTDLGSKTYSNEGTRDIRAMIDDVSDFTAKAFGIPPVLLSGKVEGTKDAVEQFLSFSVDPLAKLLEGEINRKRYGEAEILRDNYLKVDTKTVRHMDIMNAPANMEKMISSGVYCINDIRAVMGDPIINEDWAWAHFITKNYAEIEEALRELEAQA